VRERERQLGAAEYVRDTAEFQLDPPLDAGRTEPHDRRN
jgi:hypothetical protein